MGEAYHARSRRLEREAAIKILPPAFARDEDRLRRFEQEARAAGFVRPSPGPLLSAWTATSDGRRFLFAVETQQTATAQYTVMVNWAAGVKR